VLYLAEVKKQTRSFMGGVKTEIKLLACQHNDQTWSAIHEEEVLSAENIEAVLGEGALLVLIISQNRPELAGPELVRQLQKLSRLAEKLKEQREEIDQWKQSLTYQSQELSRRELELETRLEQLEEMENEFRQIEIHRKEIEMSRSQVTQEQEKIAKLRAEFGDILNLAPEQTQTLRALAVTLQSQPEDYRIGEPIAKGLEAIAQQQDTFNHYWQDLNQQRSQLEQQQQTLSRQQSALAQRREDLGMTGRSLADARLQLEIQKSILNSKQELLNRLSQTLRANEDLYLTINRLATGSEETLLDLRLDLEALESMPLGELEESVNQLQGELDKLVQFVNDQEEELTLQCRIVEALEAKVAQVNEHDRPALETELEEEQERKGMLDETLIGQRRNLKDRQEIFLQYLRILRRRQGGMELDDKLATINWNAIFNPLQEVRHTLEQDRQNLIGEIDYLQQGLQQIQELVGQLEQDYQQKATAVEGEETQLQQLQLEVLSLRSRLQGYEETLQPLQDRLDNIRPNLEVLSQVFASFMQN
jgi:chromosome segregation ATPase